MTPKGRDLIQVHNAGKIRDGVLNDAVRAQLDAEEATATPAPTASRALWSRLVLRQAGHNRDPLLAVRTALQTRAAQMPAANSYVHAAMTAIREHWRGGPAAELQPAPLFWNGDRDGAERDLAAYAAKGTNGWTLIAIAVEDLPAEAFGDCDDLEEAARQRQLPVDHAREALATLASLPLEDLVGMAWRRGLDIEPVADLPQRLVAHEAHPPAPAPAKSRRIGEAVPMFGSLARA